MNDTDLGLGEREGGRGGWNARSINMRPRAVLRDRTRLGGVVDTREDWPVPTEETFLYWGEERKGVLGREKN